jgi:hypothetical protein
LSRERGAELLAFVGSMLADEYKKRSLRSVFYFFFIIFEEIFQRRLTPEIEFAEGFVDQIF